MYGLLISLGILFSALLAERLAKRDGKDVNVLWTGLLIGLLAGIVGARLYHVFDHWGYYSAQPALVLAVNEGGLGIPGGLVAAMLAVFAYLKIKRQPALYWLDLAALVLPLGQAVGRWGNYFNNELMPYAVYESFLDLALFIFLYFLYKKSSRPGTLLALYLLIYFLVIRVLILGPYKTQFWLI